MRDERRKSSKKPSGFFGAKFGNVRFPYTAENASFMLDGISAERIPTVRNVSRTNNTLFSFELYENLMEKSR